MCRCQRSTPGRVGVVLANTMGLPERRPQLTLLAASVVADRCRDSRPITCASAIVRSHQDAYEKANLPHHIDGPALLRDAFCSKCIVFNSCNEVRGGGSDRDLF